MRKKSIVYGVARDSHLRKTGNIFREVPLPGIGVARLLDRETFHQACAKAEKEITAAFARILAEQKQT